MPGRGGFSHRTVSFGGESRHQLTAFGWETRTILPSGGVLRAQVHRKRTLHLGNVNVPPSRPAIEGSEDGGGRRAATGRKKGPSTTSSAPHAPPGRKEPGQGMVASNGPCRGTNHPTARARNWEVCTPPARCLRWPGRCSRQLQESDSAVATSHDEGSPAKSSSSEYDSPIHRCCYWHLIFYRRAEWNAGHTVRRHSRITGEPHRTAAAGGVRGQRELARWRGSHCNP